MKDSPQVSVVMSTYDDAAHLDATIESVLSQTFGDFEFIIVNDGSPDPRTGGILARRAAKDRRVHVITKQNEGLTKALIEGCAACEGSYIARMDVGDVMLPDRLCVQQAFMDQHDDVAFVSCWTEVCGPAWEHLSTSKGVDTGTGGIAMLPAAADEAMSGGPTCHPSVMFRRAAYLAAGQYRWQFYYGQDWDLWFRLAEHGKFHIVPKVLYRTRILPEGISAMNRDRQVLIAECLRAACRCRGVGQDESAVLSRAAAIRPGCAGHRLKRSRPSEGWYLVGEQLRRNGDARCRRYLLQAIRQSPWDGRPWVRLMQSFLPAHPRHAVDRAGGPVT
jgi:glycosyltransferase involved in cell wall biosynthesis